MASPDIAAERLSPWHLGLTVLAVGILYGRVVGYGFLTWDDTAFLVNNPLLHQRSWRAFAALMRPGGVPHEALYIPVTYLSYYVELALLGGGARLLHVTNLLLHMINVVLCARLLQLIGLRRAAVAAGAALFAVHPLQVEAVAWCMGRKDLLATTFTLAALILWTRRDARRRWFPSPAALALAIVALLAKPSAAVLPALLAGVEFFLCAGRWREVRWRDKIPFAVLSVGAYLLGLTVAVAPSPSPYALGFRAICLPWLLCDVLGRLSGLRAVCAFYPWPAPEQAWGMVAGGLAVTGGLGAVGIVLGRRGHWRLPTALLFLLAALAPAALPIVSGTGFREAFTADRYMYVPMVGAAILVAQLWARYAVRRGVVVLAVVWLIMLAYRTWRQVPAWADNVALWRRVVVQWPAADKPHIYLGQALLEDGHATAAEAELRAALGLNPGSAWARKYLGDLCLATGRPDDAERWYLEAVRHKPNYRDAYLALVDRYLSTGRVAAAETLLTQALTQLPGDLSLRFAQARAGEAAGDAAGAAALYAAVLRDGLRTPQVRFNLANALAAAGRYDDAARHYRALLRAHPTYVEAAINLAGVLLLTGRPAAGAAELMRILPVAGRRRHLVLYNLARAHLAAGERAAAKTALQMATDAAPGFAPAHMELARQALIDGDRQAAAGHYRRAVATGQPRAPRFERRLAPAPGH